MAQKGLEMMKAIPDLVLMSELTEDEMFRVLSRRLEEKRIYTYIGSVLVAVNPYVVLPIYGQDRIKEHSGQLMYQLEPHVYAIAENMYKQLMAGEGNPAVLISGESGAGKTEASKKIMEYIAAVSKEGAGVARIKKMLLDSNPILEAFGNAKTLRNDNSSRFGKYMEINFDFAGAPQGGRITNYLLEKVRVTNRSKGERSFHIFYQMLAGLSDQEIQQVTGGSRNPEDFEFLKKSGCHEVKGMNDKSEFRTVRDAMKSLQMSPEAQMSIWRLLAAILYLGNVEFQGGGPGGKDQDKSAIKNKDVVQKVANLLKIKPGPLDAALCSRTIKTGQQAIKTPLNLIDAQASREAFAKALYSGLFDWIVAELNKAMAPASGSSKGMTLGVLDIYGFEIFEDNSFEQWCINWCNEKLQQYFIELTLRSEQEEYAREGIEWTPVEYFDNRVICDLIEKKPGGMLAILDEDSLLAKSNDMSWLEKLNRNIGTHKHFKTQASEQKAGVKGAAKLSRDEFIIAHYAGDVAYKVEGFISKNRDIIFNDQVIVINGSADPLVSTVFANVATDTMKRPETAGTKFKASLADLIVTLGKCVPSYVRCIKPNETKSQLTVDEERFRHQLRYLGLLENVRVRRAGFCFRETYERFLGRYKMTCPSTWIQWRGAPRAGCEEILRHHKMAPAEFRLGKTKIFIKNPQQLFLLEEAREAKLPSIAVIIQRNWRKAIARMYVKRLRAAVRIQRAFKNYKSKKWLVSVVKAFKGVSAANGYGMSTAWPPAPPVLADALHNFQRIQRTWRGTDMVNKIPADQRPLYRQKIAMYDIFHGQKPWDPTASLKWNFINVPAFKGQNGDVLWAANGEKMFPAAAKMVPRQLILTSQELYKLDKGKPKSGIPLTEVTKISMSKHDDSIVIVHNSVNRAHVLNISPALGGPNDNNADGKERYSGFVLALVEAVKKVKKTDNVQVEFIDNVSVNAAKKPGQVANVTVNFVANGAMPPGTFQKGKNTATFTYQN